MSASLAWPRALAVLGPLAFLVLTAPAGCTRYHYYRQADQDAKCLIQEKSNDPRWAVPRDFTVCMDPRSRYYDPYNAVRPPMPKDDPASNRYMQCVDGMKGYKRWYRDGIRPELENPCWRERLGEYVKLTDSGAADLSLDSAVQVARINSPAYQDQLETIYLSALDVSTERFRFEVQFFGSNVTSFTHLGKLRAGGEANTLRTDSDFTMRREFATAGELLVGFANSFVWQFAGPDTNNTVSILNFNLVQPLLRNAGRAVALEQLTITERALLANLRAYQRYRQGFFTRVAVGELGVTGPQRRGGFFGGTGLTGFTGTGAGGFGGVGSATGFGRAGFTTGGGGAGGGGAGFAGGGAGQVGGFIGLLQQVQQIRNNRESLSSQSRMLRLLEAHLQAGTIDLTQVDQFRQNIETSRATLLQSENSLADSLDSFKTGTLGLPPDLPIELDDSMIKQFEFIDSSMSGLQNGLSDFLSEFGQQPAEPEVEVIRAALDQLAALREGAEQQFVAVAGDLKKTSESSAAREALMSAEEQKTFTRDLQKLAENYDDLKQRLEATGPRLDELRDQLAPNTRRQTADRLVMLVTEITSIVDELSLVQARSRVETVSVAYEKLDPEEALQIARANRLDWMNNRAALVDTWRLITYNAKALESNLSVTFSGDMSTRGNNMVKFRAPTGTLRAGVQIDPPFTRLLERNNFRQVLIDYQGDRRQLIQFGDSVNETLRSLLRNLEQLRVNLEIQRRAVAIAIRRVDQTREALNEPPPPPQPGQPTVALGPTAALNLLTALNDLHSSQNNFMSVWLNYYATRMRLARELGTMQLDDRGIWIERPLAEADRATVEEVPLPPAVPDELLEELDATPDPLDVPRPPGEAKPVTPHPANPAPGSKAPVSPRGSGESKPENDDAESRTPAPVERGSGPAKPPSLPGADVRVLGDEPKGS